MGDHRATIKIEMEFHGIKEKTDMNINYGGYMGEVEGVDDRIIGFCRNIFVRGMKKYDERVLKRYQEDHKEEIEKSEKVQLMKLLKKYPETRVKVRKE